jgi:activator of S phase kinase
VSSRSARTTQRNPVLKNKTKQNKTKQNKTKQKEKKGISYCVRRKICSSSVQSLLDLFQTNEEKLEFWGLTSYNHNNDIF